MDIISSVEIQNPKGIHARTAAIITSFVNKLLSKYDCKVVAKKENNERTVPLSSMLALTSLGVRQGEKLVIKASGLDAKLVMDEMVKFLSGEIDKKSITLEEFDKVLEENAININKEMESIIEVKDMLSNILNNISDGICLMDQRGVINYLNPAYENIWQVKAKDYIGRKATDLFPNRPSLKALKEKKEILDISIQDGKLGEIISTSAPIYISKEFMGIITIYKEVGKLKELMDNLQKATEEINYYKTELDKKAHIHKAFDSIIGESRLLKDALAMASKSAQTSATVLIRGESGTGKELVAQAIHSASPRVNKPFIKINCAAIPENLLESELFGHEKGSFTGAIQRKIGKFELANEGTIFLDEIAEISPSIQAKILRAIQEKEIQPVGSEENRKIDIRIIAATNKNLEEMVQNGNFREDLYYRLNVIPIFLPSLKNRKEDIPTLAQHLIEKICQKEEFEIKKIPLEILECFEKYNWPGNIRELENIIFRLITLSEEEWLDVEQLPAYIKNQAKRVSLGLIHNTSEMATMEEYDKEIISMAIKKYKTYNKAAKALGITHRTVSLKAKKYGIKLS